MNNFVMIKIDFVKMVNVIVGVAQRSFGYTLALYRDYAAVGARGVHLVWL